MNYKLLLEDRCAVITRGASDIGRATAFLFASHGAKLSLIDEDEGKLSEFLEELKAGGYEAYGFKASLADFKSIDEASKKALEAMGKVDILVNIGGDFELGDAESLEEEKFLRVINGNLTSAIGFTRALMPAMKDNRWGDIINITSDLATSSLSGTAAIAAAGGAMLAFTRNVTMDYIRYHVRANCISYPFDGVSGREPLVGQVGPEDAAKAALWYACKMSRFIIGDLLPVNGGMEYFKDGVI